MKLSFDTFVEPMKKFRVKSFLWILLTMLVLGWYGESFTREYSCSIDDSSLMIHGSLEQLSSGKDQSPTLDDESSAAYGEGHVSKVDVAEIEEEHDRLHSIFTKKKLDIGVCFYIPFIASDRPSCFGLIGDIGPGLRDSSISVLERYLIFRVLRI